MPIKQFEIMVGARQEAVWNFHASAESLTLLTPPSRKMRWISTDLSVRDRAVHEFQVKIGPIWSTWRAVICEVDPPNGFVDVAVKSPFKSWKHRRQFISHPDGTLIRDCVDYTPPFKILGRLADRLFLSADIDRLFKFRHQVLQDRLN